MKYIKVQITRNPNPRKPQMVYPVAYDAREVEANKQGPLVYNQGLSSGAATEEMVMYVSDQLADKYKRDPLVDELTEAEVDAWLLTVPRLQAEPTERVTDPDRLLAIQTKVAATGDRSLITQEDLDALDPTHPMRGINRRGKTAAELFGGS